MKPARKLSQTLLSELDAVDLPSVLRYAADCVSERARKYQGEDASDTIAARGNIRTLAHRCRRLANAIARQHATPSSHE